MTVGLNLSFVVSRKGTSSIFQRYPPVCLLTHLTAIAFAWNTNYMTALVGSHLLTLNFLAAYPAIVFFLNLFDLYWTEFLESQLVIPSRTFCYFWGFLLDFLDCGRSIFKTPKWSFHILIFIGIQLIDADWFDVLCGDNCRLCCSFFR